jgi:hypothetical protein
VIPGSNYYIFDFLEREDVREAIIGIGLTKLI